MAEPALERADPALAVPGSTVPEHTPAEVLMDDRTWAAATVIGQRRDARGRWCIGLQWHASARIGGREGWFVYDARRVRRVEYDLGLLLRQRPAAAPEAPLPGCMASSR